MSKESEFPIGYAALPTGELDVAARMLIQERLRGVRKSVGRDLTPIDVVLNPSRPAERKHLFEEACELYWNELNWEELTDEEMVEGGELTEMVFPGLLAFVDALLPKATNGEPDRDREHRDVAHDFMLWLGARLAELRDARPADPDAQLRSRREAGITDELIDLVAFRLYSLGAPEIEQLRRR
jgi:hypothetical protein